MPIVPCVYVPVCICECLMAPHSSPLALKILWAEEPGGLQSMGSLRVRHDWTTSLSLFTFMHWRRNWQPTPVFLPGESQGRGSLVGCRLWGHRVRHDWSGLAAAAVLMHSHRPMKFYRRWKGFLLVISISLSLMGLRTTMIVLLEGRGTIGSAKYCLEAHFW